MGLKTPEINGARQELPCLESPEINGARQSIVAVEKYVDGAWQVVWRNETYIIENGYLSEGYGVKTNAGQSSSNSNDNCSPKVTNGSYNDYYSVVLGVQLPSSGTNTGYGRVVFSPSIDLSKHKTLWFETTYTEMTPYSSSQDISSNQTLFLSNTNSVYDDGDILATAEYYGKNADGHNLYCIDISALNSTAFLHFKITFDYGGCSYSNAKNHETHIYNIWME